MWAKHYLSIYLSVYLSVCLPVCLSVWCRFLNVFAMVSLVVISGGMEWPHVFGCFWQDCLDTHCRPPQEFSGLKILCSFKRFPQLKNYIIVILIIVIAPKNLLEIKTPHHVENGTRWIRMEPHGPPWNPSPNGQAAWLPQKRHSWVHQHQTAPMLERPTALWNIPGGNWFWMVLGVADHGVPIGRRTTAVCTWILAISARGAYESHHQAGSPVHHPGWGSAS